MIPLLLPFLIDTVIAPPLDYEDLFVNEWGVVVFNYESATVAGAPDENGSVLYGRDVFSGSLCVDAPVIWIHGAYFDDATLTVKARQGALTELFPEPDATAGGSQPVSASWNISALVPESRRERPELVIPPGTPFGWAMGFWREVPSLDLFSPESGDYLGNFLYYEAGVPIWDGPSEIYDPRTLAGYYSTEGLIITAGAEPSVERIQLVPLPDGSGTPPGYEVHLTDEQVQEIICDWAGGNLKSQEISALWQTWKPFFTYPISIDRLTVNETTIDEITIDGRFQEETWILFPLPWDVVEGISSINLEVHDSVDREITYNRLFLGLVRVQ